MVSNLVFYQLVLIALVWVFLMLSWVWPSEPAAARLIPPTPVTPPRTRSTAPKPFPGLTRKPHCDACAPTIEDRRLPLPSAPPPKDHLNPWTSAPRRHLTPFLSRCGLSLWRLGRARQSECQWTSQWWTVAPAAL